MANLPELCFQNWLCSPGSNVNGSQMFSFYKKKLNVFISFMVPARGQLGEQLETCELQLLD